MPKKLDETDTAQSYEQARDELAQVVAKLEAGGATLEESLALWERGERLAAICQEWLDGARKRLAAITAKPGVDSSVDTDRLELLRQARQTHPERGDGMSQAQAEALVEEVRHGRDR